MILFNVVNRAKAIEISEKAFFNNFFDFSSAKVSMKNNGRNFPISKKSTLRVVRSFRGKFFEMVLQ